MSKIEVVGIYMEFKVTFEGRWMLGDNSINECFYIWKRHHPKGLVDYKYCIIA